MFSLRSMLLAVLVAAVFIVAFLNYSVVWANVIVTLTIAFLGVALVAIYLRPEWRPFLVPAVLVGCLYFHVATGGFNVPESIVTNRLIYEVWYAHEGESALSKLEAVGLGKADKDGLYWLVAPAVAKGQVQFRAENVFGNLLCIQRIGTCSVALVLAVIGGLVGSAVARKRQVE